MDIKWLEDFISLAQTHSFSRSAAARHVTQPAFSRRIQALESWLGVALIDRSAYPTRLTPAGEVFHEQALEMLDQLRHARSMLRSRLPDTEDTLRLATPHTLALSAVPHWLQSVRTKKGLSDVRVRLTAHNVHDAVMQFTDGGSDLLVCYYHAREPIDLDPQRYDWKQIGTELFQPYSGVDAKGQAIHRFKEKRGQPIPVLTYAASAYFARMLDAVLSIGPALNIRSVFETDMAEAIKNMAVTGLGIAWLPESTAQDAVAAGRLMPLKSEQRLQMEVRLYRQKQTTVLFSQGADPVRKALVDRVWDAWPVS